MSGSSGQSRSGRGSSSRRRPPTALGRLIERDRPFVVVAVLGLAGALLAGVAMVRWWRTTPPDHAGPVVKVSPLDLLQARSLKSTARAAEQAGDFGGALFAWRSALSQNLADPEAHRGLLRLLTRTPMVNADHAVIAQASASWLMSLTRTNPADLPLVAEALDLYGRPWLASAWLETVEQGRDAGVDAARARVAISQGQWNEFGRWWATQTNAPPSDPATLLSVAAWQVVTDPTGAGGAARARLREAAAREDLEGVLAARLLQKAGAATGNGEDLEWSLRRLEALRAASAVEHGDWWLWLAQQGRLNEATNLAAAYGTFPGDPEQAAHHVLVLDQLGLRSLALAQLHQHAEDYGPAVSLWRAYFDLLAAARRWDELERATSRARLLSHRADPLHFEIQLARLRSAAALNRRKEVEELLEDLGARDPGASNALRLSSVFRGVGRSRAALELLERHQAELGGSEEFWVEKFATAYTLRDVEGLRSAVDGLLKARPDSPQWESARAALLLITGEEPAEALRLTFAGLARSPRAPELRINHAFALVRNGRAAEARTLLDQVSPAGLGREGESNFHLARVEVAEALGRWDEVLDAAARVQREDLLPPQVERLDRLVARAREQRPEPVGGAR